jgi:DNA polymerase-3 subunit delta'
MAFTEIMGNRAVIDRLKDTIQQDHVFHAYIFEGQNGSERKSMAVNFIKGILCESKTGDACETCISCTKINHGNHEDLLMLEADGRSIKDEMVENLQSSLKKKPFSGSRVIALIDQAETMTMKAQNRLLKTLEEPMGRNIIILLTDNAGKLTRTINSRCILLRINSSGAQLMTEAMNEKYGLMDFAKGMADRQPLYKFSKSLADIGKSRDAAMEVLEILQGWFRDMLILGCSDSGSPILNKAYRDTLIEEARIYRRNELMQIITFIEKAKTDLNMNINAGYALKDMLLEIQEGKDGKSNWYKI